MCHTVSFLYKCIAIYALLHTLLVTWLFVESYACIATNIIHKKYCNSITSQLHVYIYMHVHSVSEKAIASTPVHIKLIVIATSSVDKSTVLAIRQLKTFDS